MPSRRGVRVDSALCGANATVFCGTDRAGDYTVESNLKEMLCGESRREPDAAERRVVDLDAVSAVCRRHGGRSLARGVRSGSV